MSDDRTIGFFSKLLLHSGFNGHHLFFSLVDFQLHDKSGFHITGQGLGLCLRPAIQCKGRIEVVDSNGLSTGGPIRRFDLFEHFRQGLHTGLSICIEVFIQQVTVIVKSFSGAWPIIRRQVTDNGKICFFGKPFLHSGFDQSDPILDFTDLKLNDGPGIRT